MKTYRKSVSENRVVDISLGGVKAVCTRPLAVIIFLLPWHGNVGEGGGQPH